MLKQRYLEKAVPALKEKYNYSSSMQVPRIEKVILNMTAGKEVSNSKAIEEVLQELTLISGQKPFETKAKKSNASW
ncbi:50S ribosomal protein L5, partial [Mycoplasmopsis edwardii]